MTTTTIDCQVFPTDALQRVYGGMACQPHDAVHGLGVLPFTGFEMLSFVSVGLMLIAAGYVLRRGQRDGQ